MIDFKRPDVLRPSVARFIRPARETFLRIVYPPVCPGCGAYLGDASSPLCHRCLQQLTRVEPAQLDTLLARLPEAQETLDDAFALWLFDAGGTVQRVQHLLKYGNRPHIGIRLGNLIGTGFQARATSAPSPDFVLPIPLHRARLYERGYNQSAMLARGIGQTLGVPVAEDLLERRRVTLSQTNLSRRRRWRNVADAFAVAHPARVAARRILLIDDVLTTGATLAAAAAALRHTGAASVYAATLAMAS